MNDRKEEAPETHIIALIFAMFVVALIAHGCGKMDEELDNNWDRAHPQHHGSGAR